MAKSTYHKKNLKSPTMIMSVLVDSTRGMFLMAKHLRWPPNTALARAQTPCSAPPSVAEDGAKLQVS